ncbi:MAG: Ca-activated chloride channel [Blastocatellia bacterium]|nr:Ca-activated chloride channel [Blastocatellia bacterium]
MPKLKLLSLFCFLLVLVANPASGQVPKPSPSPSPKATPPRNEDQESVHIFTEEVRLPVLAVDQFGHFDPSFELNDILVLEDGVPQQIKSVRHIPASVLILLDMGGEMSLAKSTKATREIALRLLGKLKEGDSISVMQFSEKVEVLQDWTADKAAIARVLNTKLSGGRRARLSEGITGAVERLREVPAGSRHLVIISDGVETPGGKIRYEDAVKELVATQATVHVISYSGLVRAAVEKRYTKSILKGGSGVPKDSNPLSNPVANGDPTRPPGTNTSPQYSLMTIDTDRKMRRWFRDYAKATVASEQRMTTLVAETGGRISVPQSFDDMLKQSDEVAREIGAQYVVTYRPARPLSESKPGEYRRIEVASRRVGLHLSARRGYVTTQP